MDPDSRARARNLPHPDSEPTLPFQLVRARIQARYFETTDKAREHFQRQQEQGQGIQAEAARYGLALIALRDDHYEQARRRFQARLRVSEEGPLTGEMLTDILPRLSKDVTIHDPPIGELQPQQRLLHSSRSRRDAARGGGRELCDRWASRALQRGGVLRRDKQAPHESHDALRGYRGA